MAQPSERIVTKVMPIAMAMGTPDDMRRAREIERQVEELIEGVDFIQLRSPDGSVWRLRVDNAGTLLPPTKVTP